MKKFLTLLIATIVAMGTFAQTNLAVGKTSVATSGTAEAGNDGNNGSRWESAHGQDPQLWMVDLGEATTFNVISIRWEGAYGKSFTIIAGNDLGDDGYISNGTTLVTIEGQTLQGFPFVQNFEFEAATYRYVEFYGTERGTVYGYSFYEFGVYNIDGGLVPNQISIDAESRLLNIGSTTTCTATVKDQLEGIINEPNGLTWTSSNPAVGTITAAGMFTGVAAGTTSVTANLGELVSNALEITVNAVAIEVPTTNPAAPTALPANVLAVFSDYYGKPSLTDNNPGWGVGGDAPNPLYTTSEVVRLVDNHPLVHVKGTGVNGRAWSPVLNQNTAPTAEYNTAHVQVYPFSATSLNIFKDNTYAGKVTYEGLVPGQWNDVVIDLTDHDIFGANYMVIELVGENEFYLDNFYFEKPAVIDNEAPVLEKVEVSAVTPLGVTLALKASDNVAANVIYKITDAEHNINATTTGANGSEITYAVNGLTAGTTYNFSVVAMDDNGNTSEAQSVTATTSAIVAAPVPTQPAANVISIYSNAYTPATTYWWGGWGQSTIVSDQAVDGDDLYALSNFNYLGFDGFNPQLDLSEMEYLHVDVYPMQAMAFGITPILTGVNPAERSQVSNLTAGEWNSIDIPMSQFALDFTAKAFQLKIDQGNGSDALLIDNIYFYKTGSETPVEVTAITIEATANEVQAGKTLQLTVKDQDGNAVTSGLTFVSSAEDVATVDENGLVTGVAEGNATITATYAAPQTTGAGAPARAEGEAITAQFELTVTTAPDPTEGQVLTADGHTVTLVGYHQTGTDNYVLTITSEEEMVGLGGSFWYLNDQPGNDIRTNMVISDNGHTITITATSTSEPQLYTPLYVLMPGEVNFGMVTINWIETGTTTAVTDIAADNASNGAVYSIDGRMMQRTADINALPAGIYIISGKKVVVK